MPNIATINDNSTNLIWRTALNETTGVTYKVVVKASDGTVSGYADFSAAYTAASNGDSIYLNSGTHDCGSVTFSLSKSVNIIGSGTTNCSISANGFTTTDNFVNCVISDVKFTHPVSTGTSLFVFGNNKITNVNVQFNNVHFISPSTTASQVLDITGVNIKFNNILAESSKAHVFRLRGSSNIRIKGLELKYINSTASFTGKSGLYLHSSTSTGNISDVTIDDVKIEQAWQRGIWLEVLDANTTIEKVHINNVVFDLNTSNTTTSNFDNQVGILIGQVTNATYDGSNNVILAGNEVKNSSILNVRGTMYHDNRCIFWAFCKVPSDLKILNCEINAKQPINSTSLTGTGSGNTVQIKSHTSDGNVSNIDASNFSNFAGIKNTFNSHRIDSINTSIRHEDIRILNVTPGQLLVSIKHDGLSKPHANNVANIVVGDPVALENQIILDTVDNGGINDGDYTRVNMDQCYKVAEVKTVANNDDDVTGSIQNDLFLKLTSAYGTANHGFVTTSTTPSIATTTGNLLFGKVHCEIQNRNSSISRFDVGGTIFTTGGGQIQMQIPGAHYNIYAGYTTTSAGGAGANTNDSIVNQLPFDGTVSGSAADAVQSLVLQPEATRLLVLGLAFVHNGAIYAGTFAKRITTGESQSAVMICDGSSMEITKHNNQDGNALEFKQLTLLP